MFFLVFVERPWHEGNEFDYNTLKRYREAELTHGRAHQTRGLHSPTSQLNLSRSDTQNIP